MSTTDYSVLMSVYARENPDYLKQAMDSMWNQTVPPDDFVLVCDGPLTDELDRVIFEMEKNHPELQVIRLQTNSGLGNALNEGLRYCKNEYVARMDSDDVSEPFRCEKQLCRMSSSPEIHICSGTVNEFRETVSNSVGKRELPETDREIRAFSRKRNPFNHPAVMFRKTAVADAGGYDETYHLFEDYYLWVRMLMKEYRGANLKETILYMRTPEDLYMRRGGRDYAKDMLAFHHWMKREGWIGNRDYWLGAIPHYFVCILPNNLRKMIYNILHR